jgi:hypothetical protein
MPGLVPGIHVFRAATKSWMAGTSPAMTTETYYRSAATMMFFQSSTRAVWPGRMTVVQSN